MPDKIYTIGDKPQPALLNLVMIATKQILTYDSSVLEFGSGHSTVWLASLVREVVTVEHYLPWAQEVRRALEDRSISQNVTILETSVNKISEAALTYPDEYFSMIIVDCHENQRVEAVIKSIGKLKRGGWLLLDDSQKKMFSRVFSILSNWENATIYGLFKRHDGSIRKHQTTFFRKPK